MAFAVFVKYFPELKNDKLFLVVGKYSMIDLLTSHSFLLKLLPYMSPEELQMAKLQFNDTGTNATIQMKEIEERREYHELAW